MTEKKREMKVMDRKGRLRDLSGLFEHNNIPIIRVPEDEEKEKGGEGLFHKIIAEKFSNMQKDTDIKIQVVQRTPIKFNKSPTSPRNILVKFSKYRDKERILKGVGNKGP